MRITHFNCLLCVHLCLGLTGILVTPVSVAAQTLDGWQVQWEQLRMDVKGADEHVGDVVTIKRAQAFITPPQITDQVTHDPIGLNLDAKNAFRAGVAYRGKRWGFGVDGWFLRTGDSLSGRVSSPADVVTPTLRTSELHTVLMWNELLAPVGNELEPSGYSPVDYRATGRLRTYAVDAVALAALASTDTSRLDLIVGGKIARIRTGQEQGYGEAAFFFDAFGPGRHFRNNISLSSTADASIDGAGPMVGLAGQTTWRRLRLEASMTESLLFGSADQTGTFADIDATTLAQGPLGPFAPCPLALATRGCYSIRSDWNFARSEKTTIPVTDLRLKVLVNLTRHIAVGASSFTSVWSNVPAPPSFTMSHSDAGPGLDWDLPQQSLRFGSAGVVASLRF